MFKLYFIISSEYITEGENVKEESNHPDIW